MDSHNKIKIYVFSDKRYPGWLKIGQTNGRDVMVRIREQYATVIPYGEMPFKLEYETSETKCNGLSITDHDIHYMLSAKGFERGYSEWFKCELQDVKNTIDDIKTGKTPEEYIERGMENGLFKRI